MQRQHRPLAVFPAHRFSTAVLEERDRCIAKLTKLPHGSVSIRKALWASDMRCASTCIGDSGNAKRRINQLLQESSAHG